MTEVPPSAGAPLRVALFGNVANNFYQIAKAVRAHAPDLDVHLFLDEQHNASMRPESDDVDLSGGYPPWIHRGRYLGVRYYLAPWTSPVVAELARHDLVIVSGLGPIYAQFARRPWCFWVSGGDLTVVPFPIRFWDRHRTLVSRLGNVVAGAWQRRAIPRATQIWTQPFSPFRIALERLRVPQERLADAYFPLILDLDKLRPSSAAAGDESQLARLRESDLAVFHPSRLMIARDRRLMESGQWKQNDLLIRAFARFVRSGVAARPVLAMPDRTESPDTGLAKALIAELGIEDQVAWLRAPRPFGFTREELVAYYAASHVVADDFGAGWFGSVVVEASAMERPVITYVDEAVMSQLYAWHPMLVARTEDEIVAHLRELHADPIRRTELGRRGRRWVEEFHSYEAASARYASNIRELAKRLGIPG